MVSFWAVSVGCIMTGFLTVSILLISLFSEGEILGFELSSYFLLAPITAFFLSLSVMFQLEAQRAMDFKGSALSEAVSKVFYILSGVVFSVLPSGIGLLLTTGASAFGKMIALKAHVLTYQDFNNRQSKEDTLRLVSRYKLRSIGMVVSNCILTAATIVPLAFIGVNYGANSLGQYSLVISTIFLPSALIGSAVGSVFYQKAASFWNQNQKVEITNLWRYTLGKLFFLSAPIYLVVFFICEWAYPFIFGPQWALSGELAKWISISAFFSFLAGPLDKITLIFKIGYYLPLIHFVRLVLISLVVLLCERNNASIDEFIVFFVGVMSFIYLMDIGVARFIVGLRVRHG